VDILLLVASSGWRRQPVQPVVCITADENYFSNNFCVIDVSFITHESTAVSSHRKSASPVTAVVLRGVKNDVLYNTLYCNSVYVGNLIFHYRCESLYVKLFVLNT